MTPGLSGPWGAESYPGAVPQQRNRGARVSYCEHLVTIHYLGLPFPGYRPLPSRGGGHRYCSKEGALCRLRGPPLRDSLTSCREHHYAYCLSDHRASCGTILGSTKGETLASSILVSGEGKTLAS